MRASSPPSVPRAGDIVIGRGDPSIGAFVISAFQHVTQLIFDRFEDAARCAITFAARKGVDVWYTTDGHTYQQLNKRRRAVRNGTTTP